MIDCIAAHHTSHKLDYLHTKHGIGCSGAANTIGDRIGYPHPSLAPLEKSTTQTNTNAAKVVVRALIPQSAFHSDSTLLQKHGGQPVGNETLLERCCTVTVWTHEEKEHSNLTFSSSAHDQPLIGLHSKTNAVQRTEPKLNSSAVWCSRNVSQTAPRKSNTAVHHAQRPSSDPSLHVRIGFVAPISTWEKPHRLKDAILNSINMPAYGQFQVSHSKWINSLLTCAPAMWKDEKLGLTNKALLELMPKNEGYDTNDQRSFLEQYTCWTEDFQHKVSIDDFAVVQMSRKDGLASTTRKLTANSFTKFPVNRSSTIIQVNSWVG
jgi:hypothetical protein